MKKLPVYLLLDTSGSMTGTPIEQVKLGIRTMISELKQDPQALETVHFSVITFSTSATQKLEQVPILQFPQNPDDLDLHTGGTTALGDALRIAAERVEAEVNKKEADTPGDWRPLVIIMSDGVPTDNWKAGLDEFRKVKWGARIACAVDNANQDILREVISGNTSEKNRPDDYLLKISTQNPNDMKKLFEWLSQSIKQTSHSIGSGETTEAGILEKPDSSILVDF